MWLNLKNWYRGKYVRQSLQEIIDNALPRYLENKIATSDIFEPPGIVKAAKRIGRFFRDHWEWCAAPFISIFVALILKYFFNIS